MLASPKSFLLNTYSKQFAVDGPTHSPTAKLLSTDSPTNPATKRLLKHSKQYDPHSHPTHICRWSLTHLTNILRCSFGNSQNINVTLFWLAIIASDKDNLFFYFTQIKRILSDLKLLNLSITNLLVLLKGPLMKFGNITTFFHICLNYPVRFKFKYI